MPDEEPTAELVMPFVAVTSVGGPYDDEAYVAGYEAGLLDARLQFDRAPSISLPVHAENAAQVDLIAMQHGYTIEVQPVESGWSFVTLTRSDA